MWHRSREAHCFNEGDVMSIKNNPKLSIKNITSLAGVAIASVLLSFPVSAQTTGGQGFGNPGTTGGQGTTGGGVRGLW